MATMARPAVPVASLVLLVAAAILLNYVDRGTIAVAAPLMKGELGLGATGFGIAVSAFFWTPLRVIRLIPQCPSTLGRLVTPVKTG